MKEDRSDPRTRPIFLLPRRLLGSTVVKASAVVNVDSKLQAGCNSDQVPALGPEKTKTKILKTPSTTPLKSVRLTSSGEHIIGDIVGSLEDFSSNCGGVSHGVARTAEVFDSDAGAVEVRTETLGLEDRKQGGRTKIAIPRVMYPSTISTVAEELVKPVRSDANCSSIDTRVHRFCVSILLQPLASARSGISSSIFMIFVAIAMSRTNATRAPPILDVAKNGNPTVRNLAAILRAICIHRVFFTSSIPVKDFFLLSEPVANMFPILPLRPTSTSVKDVRVLSSSRTEIFGALKLERGRPSEASCGATSDLKAREARTYGRGTSTELRSSLVVVHFVLVSTCSSIFGKCWLLGGGKPYPFLSRRKCVGSPTLFRLSMLLDLAVVGVEKEVGVGRCRLFGRCWLELKAC